MLTRSQVAQRLGKSIATIRRMEGTELHPRRDSAGVHRFDLTEVEQVTRAPRQQRFSVPLASADARAVDTIHKLNQLLANSDDKVRHLECQLAMTQKEARDANATTTKENAELREALQIALACIIEHLGPKTPPEVVQLLEHLVVYYDERA